MRRLIAFAVAAIFFLGASGLLAHERFRIVGTVTKKTAKELEVKTKENKTFGMDLDAKTVYLKDKTKIPASAIKVGVSVVVDAIGDDEDDLVAEQVRLVPALPATPAKEAKKSPGNSQ
jgi:hypothetical protein